MQNPWDKLMATGRLIQRPRMTGFQIQLGLSNVALAEVHVNHATIYSLHDHRLHIWCYMLAVGRLGKKKRKENPHYAYLLKKLEALLR